MVLRGGVLPGGPSAGLRDPLVNEAGCWTTTSAGRLYEKSPCEVGRSTVGPPACRAIVGAVSIHLQHWESLGTLSPWQSGHDGPACAMPRRHTIRPADMAGVAAKLARISQANKENGQDCRRERNMSN